MATRQGGAAMVRAVKSVATILALVMLAAGCGVIGGKSTAEVVDDTAITAAVKTKLVAEKAANLTRVDVDTNNGTVYLKGSVESGEQKARAEQLAWESKGVRGVVNQLGVQKR